MKSYLQAVPNSTAELGTTVTCKIKNVYGINLKYVTSGHRQYIHGLTGKKTLSDVDILNLSALGFKFVADHN